MQNFYFTFGQAHYSYNGTPLKDYYVKVETDSYEVARQIFISEFAKNYLPSPDKWAFQYTEAEFDSSYYPKGEIAHYVGTKLIEKP